MYILYVCNRRCAALHVPSRGLIAAVSVSVHGQAELGAQRPSTHAVQVLTRVKAGTPESSGSQRKPRASCASWFSRAPASRMSRLGGCSSAGCDCRPPILKWTAYCAKAVYLCVTSLPTALLRVSCSRNTVAPCSTQMMAMLPKPSTSPDSIWRRLAVATAS